MDDAREWAQEQFGHAELGDLRRTRRLVRVAAEVIGRPSGIVSRACATSASREGAFRLLESPHVRAADVLEAVLEKTAEDCRGKGTVIVPVDATSLSLEDDGSKGLGRIAHGRARSRGIHAVTALVLTNDGTPIGIGAQALYVRAKGAAQGSKPESEGRHGLDVLESLETRLAGTDARPWFQMDRAFDSNNVLALAAKLGSLITVRSRANRKLDTEACLWTTLARAPIRATKTVEVAAGDISRGEAPPRRWKDLLDVRPASESTSREGRGSRRGSRPMLASQGRQAAASHVDQRGSGAREGALEGRPHRGVAADDAPDSNTR
jgi:hypothetical protein